MSLENEKVKILGDFLRSRRERIKPEHIEMVGRFGRRRTPGLRREEVAHLAGVSITWYTWLEQGRVTTTSREVIESVGKALQLSSEEHLHLLRLANCGGEGDSYPDAVDFHEIPAAERVMARLIFTDSNLRKQLANWKEFADYTLGVFRSAFDQKVGDPWNEEFVRQMCQESEEFLTWKRRESKVGSITRLRRIISPNRFCRANPSGNRTKGRSCRL
jgi:transcriptional regulator with XRE-family HTH domain